LQLFFFKININFIIKTIIRNYICYNKNNNPIFISKEIGNVVAYSSDVLHEITEIKNGIRYSMVIKIHSWELFNKNKKTLI
jgi:predicted 2-oxoglutarate/Fe(II)-dependent dioxygenase YbiX